MTKEVQRANRVDQFFAKNQAALAHQGVVVPTWRVRGERRSGPYYCLECRLSSGMKSAVYLGSAGPLVAATRTRLAELRHPLHQPRQLAKVHRHLRREARAARVVLAAGSSRICWRGRGRTRPP